jgi:hypothetical protein
LVEVAAADRASSEAMVVRAGLEEEAVAAALN